MSGEVAMIVHFQLAFFFCFITVTVVQSFQAFGQYEYYYGGQVESYEEAESECEDRNSSLAIVNSKEIRDFLVSNIIDTGFPFSFYFGLRRERDDSNNNDAFEWIDGTSLSGGYEDWHTGEPNDSSGNERCVIMGWLYEVDADYKWRDTECDRRSRFICQNSSLTFKQYEYYYGGQVESYEEAESECEDRKGSLAIVNSKEIRDYLVNNIIDISFPFSFYIGLRRVNDDSNNDDAFEWIDGTSLSGGYEDWHTGEPNNLGGNERCVVMGWNYELDADYKWREVECDSRSRFICQQSSLSRTSVRSTTATQSLPTSRPQSTFVSTTKSATTELATELTSSETSITTQFSSFPDNEKEWATFVSKEVCSCPASSYLLSIILGVVIFFSWVAMMVLLRQLNMFRNKVKALDSDRTLSPHDTLRKPSPQKDSLYLQPVPMTEPHNYEKIKDSAKSQRSYVNLAVETKERNVYDL